MRVFEKSQEIKKKHQILSVQLYQITYILKPLNGKTVKKLIKISLKSE